MTAKTFVDMYSITRQRFRGVARQFPVLEGIVRKLFDKSLAQISEIQETVNAANARNKDTATSKEAAAKKKPAAAGGGGGGGEGDGAAGKSLKKFEELLRDHNDLCAKIAEAAEEVRGHLGAAVSSTAASARR